MECTRLNCPLQMGTITENCDESCPWRTTAKEGDLISRAAAITWFFRPYSNEESYSNLDVERALKAIPAVDAAPVVHGQWVKMTGMMPPEYVGHYECSVCQWHGSHHTNVREREYQFCPRCGAKMDEVER